MKKILLTVVLVLVSLICFPCSGTYYAANQEDARSIRDQFATNCCRGSVITIENLETGLSITLMTSQDGINSSCAFSNAE
ncbi:hypothetical protein ACFPIK_17905 [Algoriphagus aquatilis]|uniref:Uncharacterized protein n=1 Tax=Algoriphagus aquatilis TaxID=490186 RepID=A0ABW0C398_9BACT